ncbi:MAG: hypothetical protein AAF414_16940 [Pseudomonadota bacterium]
MTTLTADQLSLIISGNRLTFAMGPAKAVMDYHADGTLHVALPGGKERNGTWSIGPGDAYTAQWSDADGPSRTSFQQTADGFIAQDADSGEPRGQILAIHPGQAGAESR